MLWEISHSVRAICKLISLGKDFTASTVKFSIQLLSNIATPTLKFKCGIRKKKLISSFASIVSLTMN